MEFNGRVFYLFVWGYARTIGAGTIAPNLHSKEQEPAVRLLFIIVACLISLNAAAIRVTDLYKVSIAVEDQSQESREQGIQLAFQQLLIKISGYQSVLENDVLVTAAASAQQYVQGYSYQQDEVDNQAYLQVWFSKALVLPLMRKAQAPIWGENRPSIIHWLGLEQESERFLIAEQLPQWQTRFERNFNERGLPVLWPLNDLDDQAALPIEQLWWLFPDAIRAASQRYQADVIMAGRISMLAEQQAWQYQGVLYSGDVSHDLVFSADTPEGALNLASGKVAELLADQFAIKSVAVNERAGLRIRVNGVASFPAYAAMLSYLEAIPGVKSIDVAQVQDKSVDLYLHLRGDWAKVQRNIELDKRLSPLQEKEFNWVR